MSFSLPSVFSPGQLLVHLDSQPYFQTKIILEWLYTNLSRSVPSLPLILNASLPLLSTHLLSTHTFACLPSLDFLPQSPWCSRASVGGTQVWSDCFPFPKYCAFCLDSALQVTARQPPKRARPVRPWLTTPTFYRPSIRHNSLPSFVEHHPRCFEHKTPLFHSFFIFAF